ncbi:MAG TPA: hypothetical protein VF516_32430, partial [Kofleriaceae bacterium]
SKGVLPFVGRTASSAGVGGSNLDAKNSKASGCHSVACRDRPPHDHRIYRPFRQVDMDRALLSCRI